MTEQEKENMINQTRLDEETLIQEAARDNAGVPDHDCKLGPEDGCEVCERWFEARDFWVREQSETNNQKLL